MPPLVNTALLKLRFFSMGLRFCCIDREDWINSQLCHTIIFHQYLHASLNKSYRFCQYRFSHFNHKKIKRIIYYTSWSSSNAFVFGAEGQKFKSRAVQIGHSVVNSLPPQRSFSSKEAVLPGSNDAESGPANLLHASASIMKDSIYHVTLQNAKILH